jgi:hypothetical protein
MLIVGEVRSPMRKFLGRNDEAICHYRRDLLANSDPAVTHFLRARTCFLGQRWPSHDHQVPQRVSQISVIVAGMVDSAPEAFRLPVRRPIWSTQHPF